MKNKAFFTALDQLMIIFNNAQEQCDRLKSVRVANIRAGRQLDLLSQHTAQKRAIRKDAFSDIVTQLSEFDSEDLPVMIAHYLFSYGDAKQEAEKYQRLWKSSKNKSDAQYERTDLERKKHSLTREQNVLLVDFAKKTYVARRKGSDAKHAENRSMKADVFTWLDANMGNFKSMDKAAEAIAKVVAPIAFRTAREWVGEWKKLRSASTP